MSFLSNVSISSSDSPSVDAFGRWRVSSPATLFDSKQTNDSQALFWDDAETTGSGTATSHSSDEAATTISVAATTAGKRVRQTFQRFNYQPGKAQDIFITASEFDTATGITKELGYFDDDNGLFFRSDEGTLSVVIRSSVTGSAVDTVVSQSSWNIDPLDGTGDSGINLDESKFNIYYINFGWLGGDDPELGVVIGRNRIPIHRFASANVIATVNNSTPNSPLRYSIENDGTGAADDFVTICASVQSEGGFDAAGKHRYFSTENNAIQANTAGTIYAVCGIRLKTTYLDCTVMLDGISMINSNNDDYEWMLMFNPTLANAITFSDETNSCVQTGPGNAGSPSNSTVTGGNALDGGIVKSGGNAGMIVDNPAPALSLGAAIDGTRDEIYLCVRPFTNGADIYGSITWRELQ